MRTLPKLLCAITLLSMSGLVWASCPEGYRENDRTGECKKIQGFKESIKAEKEEKKQSKSKTLKKVKPKYSLGKFVKYLGVSWMTKPTNTQEAIEYYLKGRKLDPVEGAWLGLYGRNEFVIVKNTFGIARGYQYLAIQTKFGSGSYKVDRVGSVILLLNNRAGRYIGEQIWESVNYGYCLFCSDTYTYSWTGYWEHLLLASNGDLIGLDTGSLRFVKLYPEFTDEPVQGVAGSGTGFFVSSDGYVVTNHHVIEGANKITVTTPSGESFEAKVVSTSTSTDLALLRIPYQTKNYLTFANPSSTDIGHQVFTLGYPVSDILGKEVKYTDGSISSLSEIQGDATFFQISVPIQPGNSGGPLVNEDGDVVGVVTATAAVETFYKSVGAMPQNVNWAVKGAYASLLLPPTMEMNERPKSNPIANAKWSVVFIETE